MRKQPFSCLKGSIEYIRHVINKTIYSEHLLLDQGLIVLCALSYPEIINKYVY